MSTAILIVVAMALYGAIRFYSDKSTKRLPSLSTPKGRESRVVIGMLMLMGATALVLNVGAEETGRGKLLAVVEVLLGVGVGLVAALMRIINKSK